MAYEASQVGVPLRLTLREISEKMERPHPPQPPAACSAGWLFSAACAGGAGGGDSSDMARSVGFTPRSGSADGSKLQPPVGSRLQQPVEWGERACVPCTTSQNPLETPGRPVRFAGEEQSAMPAAEEAAAAPPDGGAESEAAEAVMEGAEREAAEEYSWPQLSFDRPPRRLYHFARQFRSVAPAGGNGSGENFLKGVKWSPDGSSFLTSSDDNSLRLFYLLKLRRFLVLLGRPEDAYNGAEHVAEAGVGGEGSTASTDYNSRLRIRDGHASPRTKNSCERDLLQAESDDASRPAEEMVAANRPLFVIHEATGECFVYDIYLKNEDTTMEVHYSGPLVPPLHYRPLAVSGGAILGVTPQPWHIPAAHHRPMAVIAAGGELRDPSDTGPPVMVAVGDATVVRMDTVIYGESFCFEALRLLPGGGGCWHVTPLPRPPVMSLHKPWDRVSISSYFVKGTRVWISVAGEGIFSLEVEEGAWRLEFPEEMEWLEGRALYVPELDTVVGLTPWPDRFLCAYKFDERGVPRWQRRWPEAIPWECYYDGRTPSKEMVSLAYLGKGRFCITRPVDKVEDNNRTYQSNSFLVVELRRRTADGELELAKRGTLVYQGEQLRGQCLDRYFIQ
nr:unnamed protein product [Digitaria exilis]